MLVTIREQVDEKFCRGDNREAILVNKDGSEQRVAIIYGTFTEDGGGSKKVKYSSPVALVECLDIDPDKPWRMKTVPIKFLFTEKQVFIKQVTI